MDDPDRDDLPLLHGARIDLRGFRQDDLQDFYAMHADPKVARYGSHPPFTELSQATERFERELSSRDAGRALAWVIADRDTDRLMGSTALFAIDREQGRAELGYALRPEHWGKGYAQEAVRLVLEHAFGTLHLRRIEADIDPRNTASCKLVERLGFVREGLLRERWNVAGEISDAAFYGLLASEWRQDDQDR